MSYLSLPRLTFAGTFQADVNTVNNDVRHFDNARFEANFQKLQHDAPDRKGTVYNGWWNPDGTNSFRLLDCRVSGAVGENGASVEHDYVSSLQVNAQLSGTAGKIVDLDPYLQTASTLWGIEIALTDGAKIIMSAKLEPSAFRDIYFGRLIDTGTGNPVQGSPGASTRFTGRLKDIVWDADAQKSQVLAALQRCADAESGGDGLTLSLLTYGFGRGSPTAGGTFGLVGGTIGWRAKAEPRTFAPGRRFAPSTGSPFASAEGFGYMNAAVAADGTTVTVDFGNSLPLVLAADNHIQPPDLGAIKVVVMRAPDEVVNASGKLHISAGSSEGQFVEDNQYELIGTLSGYANDEWLPRTGGVVDLSGFSAQAKALLADHPLAIVTTANGKQQIAIRETAGGVWVRAEDFIQRVDTVSRAWVDADATLYAMQYGTPFADAPIAVSLGPPGQGDASPPPNEIDAPQAPIYNMNVPANHVRVSSALTTDAEGRAIVAFNFLDPGNPRKYIDGQIYEFNYAFNADGQSAMPMFEFIGFHVRDAFVPPEVPSWETDLAPIFIQYGNLYPAMSRGLFNFADYSTVAAHARVLLFAFTRPIEDPNYMPVTRDLSSGKVAMITKWLAGFFPEWQPLPAPPPRPTRAAPLAHLTLPSITPPDHPTRPTRAKARAIVRQIGASSEGKDAALRSYLEMQLGQSG